MKIPHIRIIDSLCCSAYLLASGYNLHRSIVATETESDITCSVVVAITAVLLALPLNKSQQENNHPNQPTK